MSRSILSASPIANPREAAAYVESCILAAQHAQPHSRPLERIDAWRFTVNAQRLDAFFADPGQRSARERLLRYAQGNNTRYDSVAGGINGGLFFSRQLEQVAAEVLRQPLPELNALKLFPVDDTVAPGAITYTVRRVYERGTAALYRGKAQRPATTASLTGREEQVPIRHAVAAATWSLFEANSANFAGFDYIGRMLDVARRAIAELHNSLLWNGSNADGLYGVLNYPWLDKLVESTTFSATADKEAMLNALFAAIEYPEQESLGAMAPTHVVMSIKLWNFLNRTSINLANGSNMTMLNYLAENNAAGIPRANFIKVQELQDAGPASTQGFFVYRRDRDAIRAVVSQSTTTLPLQQVGFDNTQYLYSSFGGLIMPDVGANLLVWIDLET